MRIECIRFFMQLTSIIKMKNKRLSELILLVGNIGSGKTTFAKNCIKNGADYIVVSRDALRYMIGAGKYRFELDFEHFIWEAEEQIFKTFLSSGKDILVDEIGISKIMRKRYIDLAKKNCYTVTVIELPKISMKKSVNNRMKNPHGQPDRKLWESVWKKFEMMYEVPGKDEGIDKIIKLK